MQNGRVESILIIANGEAPCDRLLYDLVRKSDCIIAADGGSNLCHEKNIYPHFIVGDLDSIQPHVLPHFKDAEIIQLSDQYTHDLDKAVNYAKSLNPNIIRVVGAFGKRLDHSVANLLLLQITHGNFRIEFYDNYGHLTLISQDISLDLAPGHTVSLFSFLPVWGVSLKGFKYPLNNEDFPDGFIGLSNLTDTKDAHISLKKGSLFLYITHENIKS